MPTGPVPTLLLTRPEDDSRRVARRIGWPAVISPVLRIVPVPFDADRLARAGGLVFTSAHAISAAGPGRGRPAYCVGARTAERARAAGFSAIAGPGDAAGLLPLIAAATVPLLHPHGRHVAQALPVPGIVVYDQQPQALTDEAQALLGGDRPVVLPLYSPRSARLLGAQVLAARAPLWIAAISPATLAAWRGPAARHRVAARPDPAAMEEAIRSVAVAEQS